MASKRQIDPKALHAAACAVHQSYHWYSDERTAEAAIVAYLKVTGLPAEIARLRAAIEYAHSEGFEWPNDPFAER